MLKTISSDFMLSYANVVGHNHQCNSPCQQYLYFSFEKLDSQSQCLKDFCLKITIINKDSTPGMLVCTNMPAAGKLICEK